MSDVEVPGPAADLLDADPDEFDDSEAFREFVDERLAEIQSGLDDADDRLDAQGARDDALSRQIDAVRETAEDARRRADRAERMAAWGGLGYEDRVERVVTALVARARQNDGRAAITPTEEDCQDMHGNRYTRPGVVDVLDGAVSERTARRYVGDLGDCAGLSTVDGDRGGWGGGSEQSRLRLDLRAFFAAYGSDWTGDDLADDMGRDDG